MPKPAVASRCLPVLVTLLLATPTMAQKREPVRGSVTAAEQKPWAGAQVALLSRPLPDDDRFGEADELHAVSDAKGRFEVALLPGRRYLAWASAELPDGTYVASHAALDVRAGRPLELIADAPRPHATVLITGLEPWRQHGAITCTLLARSGVLLLQACEEHDGKVILPAFPVRRAALELRCGERPLLPWPEAVDMTMAGPQQLRVQPPRAVRFRCVDAAQRPLQGVAYVACDLNGRHSCTEIARSDADGMLLPLLPLPARFHWGNYPMLLLAAGRAPRSWIGTLKIPADHDAAKSPPLQTWVLDDGRQLQSRLCLGGDAVTAGKLRLLCGMATADRGNGTREESLCVPLGADGAFAVDVDPAMPAVLTAFLPAAVQARLPQTPGFPLHAEVMLAAVGTGAATPALPERIDLQQLAALDVQVLGADGTPADSAQVGLAVPAPRMHRALLASTDRSGRVRLLLPKDQQLLLCCWSETGVGYAEVDTGKLTAPLRPRLQPCQRLPGTVVDGKGHAVAWAEVVFFTGNDSAEPAGALANCLGHCLRVRTDAEGRFALPLYPGLRYSLSAVNTPDDDHYPKAAEFAAGADAPEQLTIDLSVRR